MLVNGLTAVGGCLGVLAASYWLYPLPAAGAGMGQRVAGGLIATLLVVGVVWLMARRARPSAPDRAEKWVSGSGAIATVLVATVVQGLVEGQMKPYPEVDLSWIGIKLLLSGLAAAFLVFVAISTFCRSE